MKNGTILAVTERSVELAEFLNALQEQAGMDVMVATSGKAALERMKADQPPFVVLDLELPDAEPFRLAMDILSVSAMTNLAAITGLSEADFHDKSEGLGMLCAIPPEPGATDALPVAEQFRRFA